MLCDNSSRLPAVNYYHKALHLRCCRSPRSASGISECQKQMQVKGAVVMRLSQIFWCPTRYVDTFSHFVFFYYKMCTYTDGLMKIWKSHLKIDTLMHLKIIYWKCRILNPDKSRIIYPQSLHLFWKIRLIFNLFYCFRMFVNKKFTYLRHVCFKRWKVLWYDTFGTLFLCRDKNLGRFSDLH